MNGFLAGGTGIECVEFFSRLEPNGFAGRNAHLGASAWIASDAGLTGTNAEDAKAAQFNAIAGGQGLLQSFEDGIDSCFSLGSGQACPLNDVMDNILLDQCRSLSVEVIFAFAR